MHISEQERETEREPLGEIINEWKQGVEGKWSSVQEEWSVEKDCLRRARDEREMKTKTLEDGIVARIESRLSITPSGSRSLSSDSMRPRSRKKRNGLHGRTKSPARLPDHSPIPTPTKKNQLNSNDGPATCGVTAIISLDAERFK